MIKNNFKFKKAFTLIELLTVVSIVSLLASVILGSVNSARDQARMSATVQFEAGMLHAIGDQLVGEWRMDETSGNIAVDTSSFGNNGTISGTFQRVPGIRLNGIALHEAVSTIVVPGSKSLNLYKNSFSASIWIKTTSVGDMKIFRIGANAELNYYNGTLRSCFNNCENSMNKPVSDGKWHNVAVIGDTASIRLYFDGILQPANSLPPISDLMTGGVAMGWGTTFEGTLDEFRLYAVPLNVAQVEQLYAEGKKTHEDLASR